MTHLRELARKHLGPGYSKLTRAELLAALKKAVPGLGVPKTAAVKSGARRAAPSLQSAMKKTPPEEKPAPRSKKVAIEEVAEAHEQKRTATLKKKVGAESLEAEAKKGARPITARLAETKPAVSKGVARVKSAIANIAKEVEARRVAREKAPPEPKAAAKANIEKKELPARAVKAREIEPASKSEEGKPSVKKKTAAADKAVTPAAGRKGVAKAAEAAPKETKAAPKAAKVAAAPKAEKAEAAPKATKVAAAPKAEQADAAPKAAKTAAAPKAEAAPKATKVAAATKAAKAVAAPKVEPVAAAPKAEPVAVAPKVEPVAAAPKVEPVAAAPKAEPVAAAPKVEPVAAAPKIEPVAAAPKAVPVAAVPKAEPVAAVPKAAPVAAAPKVQPVAAVPKAEPGVAAPKTGPMQNGNGVTKGGEAAWLQAATRLQVAQAEIRLGDAAAKHNIEHKDVPRAALETKEIRLEVEPTSEQSVKVPTVESRRTAASEPPPPSAPLAPPSTRSPSPQPGALLARATLEEAPSLLTHQTPAAASPQGAVSAADPTQLRRRRRAGSNAEPVVEGFFVARIAGRLEAERHSLTDASRGSPSAYSLGLSAPTFRRIVLLPRDPQTLFVFFDLAGSGIELREGEHVVVRIFDDGQAIRQLDADQVAHGFYVEGLQSLRSYYAEAWALGPKGERFLGPSSNAVTLPGVGAPAERVRFLKVPWTLPLPRLRDLARAGQTRYTEREGEVLVPMRSTWWYQQGGNRWDPSMSGKGRWVQDSEGSVERVRTVEGAEERDVEAPAPERFPSGLPTSSGAGRPSSFTLVRSK